MPFAFPAVNARSHELGCYPGLLPTPRKAAAQSALKAAIDLKNQPPPNTSLTLSKKLLFSGSGSRRGAIGRVRVQNGPAPPMSGRLRAGSGAWVAALN
jgi:hypothetical protein